jgi:hypothetical protein
MPLLEQHTAEELAELLKAKDYSHSQLWAAIRAAASAWKEKDPIVFGLFARDAQLNLDKYQAARTAALRVIAEADKSPFAMSLVPAEDIYEAVMRTDQKVPNTLSPGDFQDLHARLAQAAASLKIPAGIPSYPKMPQPAVDLEQRLYTATSPLANALPIASEVDLYGAVWDPTGRVSESMHKSEENRKKAADVMEELGKKAGQAFAFSPLTIAAMVAGGGLFGLLAVRVATR